MRWGRVAVYVPAGVDAFRWTPQHVGVRSFLAGNPGTAGLVEHAVAGGVTSATFRFDVWERVNSEHVNSNADAAVKAEAVKAEAVSAEAVKA